jgi:lipoprotein-releasing system ATP-binding protein
MSAARVEVVGLRKGYPGLDVLRGVDLRVQAGEVVAIRGQSGTGKSTLLHCLGLLDRGDSGHLRIDGQDIAGLSASALARLRARRVGFVFQAFHLLPEFTVAENILMAARAAGSALGPARVRCEALLRSVGLGDRVGSDVRTLSGGERQRVALCRALLLTPALLLADEPTGNLDPTTAAIVLDEILSLARRDGAAVVLVTHDQAIAERADRTLMLRDGCLHAD